MRSLARTSPTHAIRRIDATPIMRSAKTDAIESPARTFSFERL